VRIEAGCDQSRTGRRCGGGVQANNPANISAFNDREGGSLEVEVQSGLPSLQEFKVASVNTSAECPSSNTTIMVTKQGTNQLHGQLYEHLQNTSLDASMLFANATGAPEPQLIANQFGANVGGPIKKDKAWFFFDFEGLRPRKFATAQFNMPSMAMRQGDFSALCSTYCSPNGVCTDPNGTQLYNSFTGKPFPGNVVPASMNAPQAQSLMPFLPAPTIPSLPGLPYAVNNYFSVQSEAEDMDQYNPRGDYQLSPRDSLAGVSTHSDLSPWDQSNARTELTFTTA